MTDKSPNSNEELDVLAHVVAQEYGKYFRASLQLTRETKPESIKGWKARRRQADAMVNLLEASYEYDHILLRLDYEARIAKEQEEEEGERHDKD